MLVQPIFKPRNQDEAFDFIDRFPLGTLITLADEQLLATPLPFMVDRTRGPNGTLIGHMALGNPHYRALDRGCSPSMVVFLGPHAYVSPSWYGDRNSAPGWNYLTIHCSVRIRFMPDRTSEYVRELVDKMEHSNSNAWNMSELGDDGTARRMRFIIGFEADVLDLHAKFKLGQNERVEDVSASIARLRTQGDGILADYMGDYNQARLMKTPAELGEGASS